MHLVVEKAADTGGADAGGFRLEVQNLPEHSAFPMERSIAPGVACRDLVMGEHPQRIAGIRGDVLVTADEPGGVAEVMGDEQISGSSGGPILRHSQSCRSEAFSGASASGLRTSR